MSNPVKPWKVSVSRACPAMQGFQVCAGLYFHAIVSPAAAPHPHRVQLGSVPSSSCGMAMVHIGISLISPDLFLRSIYLSLNFLPLHLSLPFMQMVQLPIKMIPIKLYFLISK